MKSFTKVLGFVLLTVAAVLTFYVYQDGAGHARERLERLGILSPQPKKAAPVVAVATPTPAPTTPAPVVKIPEATPAPAPVAAATPVPAPSPNDPAEILKSLAASRQEWPRQIALKKEETFLAMLNGSVVGHFAAQPGTQVALVGVRGTTVAVTSQGSTKEIEAADTNLVEEVIYNRSHAPAPVAAVRATPAVAATTPAAATTPVPFFAREATTTSPSSHSGFVDQAITDRHPAAAAHHSSEVDAIIKDAEALAPTFRKPLKTEKDDQSARDHWKDVVDKYMAIPAEEVTAHPSAADYPGTVADSAPRIKRSMEFPKNLPRWQSTGLYAAPGEKITVRVTSQEATKGLSIVIGAQHDTIYKRDSWPRFPQISRTFKITKPLTTVANAFGGLIYVDIPRDPKLEGFNVPTYGGYGWLDEHPHAVAGSIRVEIEGGVPSPLYQMGKTSATDWNKQLESQAPWGEIGSDKIILTLPTDVLKTITDPAPLLEYWGKVVDAEAELAGWPKQPAPPERLVPDREISAGWMHSAYPVMYHAASTASLVDLEKLKKEGDWGFFHELGHNHEAQACTFGGDYVEVNVNFFSLYVMEKFVGSKTPGHNAMNDVDKLIRERLASDPNTDAFHNLAMYVLPIRAFGWAPFQKTLASYAVPDAAKNIKTREDKMDQWVLRYSKATGHNLSTYFAAFGVTCTGTTKDALKNLPEWLPNPGFPQTYTGSQPAAAQHTTAGM